MACSALGCVVQPHHAGRTVRTLTDAEDSAVALCAHRHLVEHLDGDRKVGDADGRALREVGRAEPLGGDRDEVLDQRDSGCRRRHRGDRFGLGVSRVRAP